MANSAVVGLLRVLLTANTAEFSSAMKRSSDEARKWSRDLKQIGTQMSTIGSSLTRTLTVPILGVGAAVAKAAIDFESSFAGVRKTVDATEAEFAEMAMAFRGLSKEIPVNVNELNKLGEAAGALGIPKTEIVDFTRVMAEMGVTTDLTSDQAANAIARIQNIFGAAGKDTERLASTIVALGNAGASTEKEIVEMGLRIAGAGHTVGLSQAQVVAFASTLASVGINAEAGGSAISRVFLKMNDAVAKGGGGLQEFARVANMSASSFKEMFERDAAGAMSKFIEGLGRLKASGENVNATIEGLTGKNIILKDTLFRLSGAGQLLNEQLKIADGAWKSNTALADEARKRFETTESRLTLLWNRIKDVGITLGNALRPSIDMAIRGVEKLLPLVDSAAQAFAKMPAPLQATAVGIALVAAATGPAIYGLGQLTLSGSALIGAFTRTGVATRALSTIMGSSLGATVAALSVPVALLGTAILGARAATGSWAETLKLIVVPFSGTLRLIETMIDRLGLHNEVVSDVVRIIQDAWIIGLRNLKAALSVAMDAVELFANTVTGVLKAAVREAQQALGDLARFAGQALPDGMKNGLIAIGALTGLLPGMKQRIHDAADAMDKLAGRGGAVPTARHNFDSFKDLLTGGFVPATKSATGATKGHTDALDGNTGALKGNSKATEENATIKRLLALANKNAAAEAAYAEQQNQAGIQGTLKQLNEYAATVPRAIFQTRSFAGVVDQLNTEIIPHFVPQVRSATQAVNEWGTALGETLSTLPGLIQRAFTGGGGFSGAMKAFGAQFSSDFFGEIFAKGSPGLFGAIGSFVPGIGQAIGALLPTVLGPLWNKFFGTAGRDAVKEFAATFAGGFDGPDGLHDTLLKKLGNVGEDLWKELTQQVGRNDKARAEEVIRKIQEALANAPKTAADLAADAGYKTQADLQAVADKAKQVYDFMVASGQYSAAQIADAYEKMRDAQIAAMDDTKKAAYDAAMAARDNAKAVLDALDSQIKSLQQSVDAEAVEEFMGAEEQLNRARIEDLKKQRAEAQKNLDEANKAIEDAASAAVAAAQAAAEQAGKATVDAIQEALDRADFRVKVNVETGGVSTPYGGSAGAAMRALAPASPGLGLAAEALDGSSVGMRALRTVAASPFGSAELAAAARMGRSSTSRELSARVPVKLYLDQFSRDALTETVARVVLA